MSHRDIEALKERIKVAKAKPKRNYRKANLSQTKKAELCQALVEADVAVKESLLNREAIMWQTYKAGLPASLMAQSLDIAEGTLYERLKVLRKTLGVKTK